MKPFQNTNNKNNKNKKIIDQDRNKRVPIPSTHTSNQFSSPRFETSLQLQFLSSINQGTNFFFPPLESTQTKANQQRHQHTNYKVEDKQKASLHDKSNKLAQSTYQFSQIKQMKQLEKISMCQGCLSRFQQILGYLIEQISLVSLDFKIMKEQINIEMRSYFVAMSEDFQKIVSSQFQRLIEEKVAWNIVNDYEKAKIYQDQAHTTSAVLKRQTKASKIKRDRQFGCSRTEFHENQQAIEEMNAEFPDLLRNSRQHQLQTNLKIEEIKKTINGLKRKLTKSTSITY